MTRTFKQLAKLLREDARDTHGDIDPDLFGYILMVSKDQMDIVDDEEMYVPTMDSLETLDKITARSNGLRM